MTTGVACPPVILQFFDNYGNPLSGGSILTQVGGVNAATYSDSGLTTALPNPIPLNSRGEVSTAAGASSQLFLTPNQVYTFTVYDSGSNQIWQGTYINGVQQSAEATASELNPITDTAILNSLVRSAAETAAGVTPSNYAYPECDLRRYGARIDGSTDDTAAINAAISVATAASGRGYIYHPGGTCCHASQITVPNGLAVVGFSRAYCIFKFTGTPSGSPANTRSAWRYSSGAVNSSGYANVAFRHVQINVANSVDFGAAIELNAGGWSYFEIDDCWIKGGCSYGVILDAVEICAVHNCLIENTNATSNFNIWIVNGADRSASQEAGFSNIISIRENQISGGSGSFGITDDGGNEHIIQGNNFNQHSVPLRLAGVTGLRTVGNSYETSLQTGNGNVIFIHTTSSGNVVGPCQGVKIEADGFYGDIASGSLLSFSGSANSITGITKSTSAVVTVSTGGSVNPFAVNAPLYITAVSGMTQINGKVANISAIGGVSGAWTATLNLDSSGYSAYTSGGQAQMMHSGCSVCACNFGSQLGRGAAIDVTFLANSVCEANNDFGTASMFHYTGVHNDNCGSRLMPPQNGALPILNITGPTYGDTRYPELHAGGITLSAPLNPSVPGGGTQTGAIYQGFGVPANANGNNGDVYFRTDTPGTANQRLYIKSAGSWTGIA